MRIIKVVVICFLKSHCELIVNLLWGNIWKLRQYILAGGRFQKGCRLIYYWYFDNYAACIGLGAKFADIPCFPHGFFGIFISNSAQIGKGGIIFHQVTIGSNMLPNSKKCGAPTIGDNVYIGCGAKLIGQLTVGNNARIGANAIVVKNIPANSVTV